MKKVYFVLNIKIDPRLIADLELFLAENISWGWEEEKNLIKIYFDSLDGAEDFSKKIKTKFKGAQIEIAKYFDLDWSKEWKKYFKPIEVGKFKIIPSWNKGKISLHPGQIPIYIYPEMAFGTGHHPTTKLCLISLLKIHKKGFIKTKDTFLDVGTGSGILTIAATLLGLKGVALDIDKVVMKNFKKNIELNGLDFPCFFIGTTNSLKKEKKFKLIMANILLDPILDLKNDFVSLLNEKGIIIISGILNEQENRVIHSYKSHFSVVEILQEGEWSSIIFKRK